MPRPRPRRGAAVCGAAAAGLLAMLLFAALRTPSLGLSSVSPAVLRGTATPLLDRPSRPPGVALRIGAKRPQLASAGVKSTAFSPATVNISSPSIGKVVGTIALPFCLILGFLLRSSSRPGPLTLAATVGTAPGAAEGPAAVGPPAGPWDLELRFGKHKGQRLSQVPVAYLRWMKQQKLHTNYPSLEPGLRTLLAEEWEALSDEAPPSPPKPAVTDSQGPAAQPNPSPAAGQPTSLVVPFGRFKGRPLDEVPEWYLAWLETVDEMPDEVREALVKRKATNT